MHPHSILFAVVSIGFLGGLEPLSAAGGDSKRSPFDTAPGPGGMAPDLGLKEVQVLKDERLEDVTSIVVAPGGKHAYAAAFNPGSVSILDRNPDSGELTLRKSIGGKDHDAAVAFRLSTDGKLGAVSCFRARALILYARDPDTGDLEKLDVAGGPGDPRKSLGFCIDNVFSPDGKHVYTIGSSAIGVFSIKNGQLVEGEMAADPPQQRVNPEDGARPAQPAMRGGRGIAVSPDGRYLYAGWNSTGALTVHQRDPVSGALTHIQTIRENGDEVVGVRSIMGVTVSRDGRFVYTSGGRFGNLDAVCVFSQRNGELSLVQSLHGKNLPAEFGGGNEIVLSPNQREVAVACTGADTIARFHRDPETGKLSLIGIEESGPKENPGPAGLCWSSNGKFIHVADEESGCIVTFRKKGR
ncbi:MAG: beta-propeller fold lactonase family protein [Verrucomicrobiota bacterium]